MTQVPINFFAGGRRDPLGRGGERAAEQADAGPQYLDEVTWTTKNWLGLQKPLVRLLLSPSRVSGI